MSESRITVTADDFKAIVEMTTTAFMRLAALLEEDPAFGLKLQQHLQAATHEASKADTAARLCLQHLAIADQLENGGDRVSPLR